jgi:hypothetical protein
MKGQWCLDAGSHISKKVREINFRRLCAMFGFSITLYTELTYFGQSQKDKFWHPLQVLATVPPGHYFSDSVSRILSWVVGR